jgi:hypothetical protein
MLFANRCTWAHLLASAAALLRMSPGQLMSGRELAAVNGEGNPADLN